MVTVDNLGVGSKVVPASFAAREICRASPAQFRSVTPASTAMPRDRRKSQDPTEGHVERNNIQSERGERLNARETRIHRRCCWACSCVIAVECMFGRPM